MDLSSFRETLKNAAPPESASLALKALWWDAKGDWDKAHEFAQARDDAAGMRVHAYLHRREGDQGNAEYWYRRCRTAPVRTTLDEEWADLVQGFLKEA